MEGKLSCLVRTHRAHFLREGYLTFYLVDRLKTSFFPLCLACARDSDSSCLVFGFEFHSYVPSTTVVRPAVVSLLESILSLPRYQSKFKVEPEVSFALSYQGPGGDDDVVTIVKGVTDHVLMPRDKGFAVATVELKQSTENIAQPKDEAKFVAELSAEFKRILDVSLFKPHEMCGAITNGISWAFARRFVWRGEYYLHYAHVVYPANNDIQQEVDDFFESVASFLIHMMEVSVDIADGVSMQYTSAAAAAVLSGGVVDGVSGGESDDERDNKSNQDDGPDGGKFISGQAPKPMKRPYGFCDDDSNFIASLTSANLKKYAIRG